MTTERYIRCKHCGIIFQHVMSGWKPDTSSMDHCGSCNTAIQTAIREALKAIPVLFAQVYHPTTDVSLEQLLEWEALAEKEADAKWEKENLPGRGGFYVVPNHRPRRVSFPLFDQKDPDNKNHRGTVRGRDRFTGRTFTYSYWSKGTLPTEIKEECEKNITTGQLLPWAI